MGQDFNSPENPDIFVLPTIYITAGIDITDLPETAAALRRAGLPADGTVIYHKNSEEFTFHHDIDDEGQQFTDPELLDAAIKAHGPPPPTAPNPPPPEVIPDTAAAIAVSTSPDVCRAPRRPCPFPVYGRANDDQNYASTVRSNGQTLMTWGSRFTTTYGDEAGTGGGVISGTRGSIVAPTSHSPLVFAEGQPLIRHRDSCTLNSGNCPGEFIHVDSTATHPAPDGRDQAQKSRLDSFRDGFMGASGTAQTGASILDKAGEYWDDPSQIGRDAQGLWDARPSWSDIQDGAQNIASGAAAVGRQVVDDPRGSAGAVWNWGAEGLSDAWNGVEGAWEDNGLAGAAGVVAGLGVDLINPFRKAKAAGEAADALGDIGDATRAGGATRRRRRDEVREEEDGRDGARSTRRISLREQYLGRTPGKNSRTGREVRERMRQEGTLRTDRHGRDEFLGEDNRWYPVDSPQTHMGHHPVDAVDYWNETGRFHGAKSREVRDWMLDSSNYRFEYGPLNSARGGSTSARYLPPVER
ncbi:MAG: DUF4150 domain-containing protein [Paracoccus sp. (in: a-proteobacteria)]|uniref:PAAR-like domain-containing protein n=1 Tax=Paracoccus sp. TaxID=267 RepID=UPI0026E090C2|nr:PAAR-like domain-containing protein [Paracoccus sp. (in: a-proteobacteria)]MDO5612453.1 DUF4150 domain-containing protein [Paracoccus sp. (in: a-proteobacteria)]